jgi:hydroxymethylpyrimidine pyrophosphatase-like HAD family hydrolase
MRSEGMNATVSSIHINGWFGEHTKLTGARWIVQRLLARDLEAERQQWVYVGDSTNDQLMFGHFALSVGVANLMVFADQLSVWPAYLTTGARGAGFAEVAQRLLAVRGLS